MLQCGSIFCAQTCRSTRVRNLGRHKPVWRWPVKLKALSGTLLLLLISSAARQTLRAQTSIPSLFNPISASSQGVHLYGISVFSGYYTGSGPLLLPVAVQTPLNSGSDVAVGASASFGWNRSGERSGVAVG